MATEPAGDAIYASIASIPERRRSLARVVASLLDQVDRLHVYLNGYSKIPEYLDHPRIAVARSQRYGDRGDAGKFFWADRLRGFHFTCDDDIVYPPDYVRRLTEAIEARQRRVAVGVHGVVLRPPIRSYYESRRVYCHLRNLPGHRRVHVLGTGTLAYHTETLRVRPADFEWPNMADIWFARLAQRQGVPLLALAHGKRWLRQSAQRGEASIFRDSTRGRRSRRNTGRRQTEVVRAQGRWRLLVGPTPRPVATVVVVARRDRGWLDAAIRSALEQDAAFEYEVILAADGAPQLATYAQRHGIRFVCAERPEGYGDLSGFGRAFNLGLEHARAPFFRWLADDDTLTRNALLHQVRAMERGGADFIHANARAFGTGRRGELHRPGVRVPDLPELLRKNHIHAGTTMYRTDVLREVGGVDAQLRTAEEFELHLRLLARGYRLGYTNAVVHNYRRHDKQKSLGRNGRNWPQRRREIIAGIKRRYAAAPGSAPAGFDERHYWDRRHRHRRPPLPSSSSPEAQRKIDAICELISTAGLRSLIDLGCGDGAVALEIARRVPLHDYLGLDISTVAIARARSRTQGLERLSFEVEDIARGTLPGRADCAIALDLLWHLSTDARAEQLLDNLLHTGERYVAFTAWNARLPQLHPRVGAHCFYRPLRLDSPRFAPFELVSSAPVDEAEVKSLVILRRR